MGSVKIRLVEGKDIERLDWSYLQPISGRNPNPCVTFKLADLSVTSSVVNNKKNPLWFKEDLFLQLKKDSFKPSDRIILEISVNDHQGRVKSALPKSVTGDTCLGFGELIIEPVLFGEEEVIDTWIKLSPGNGQIRVKIAYDPIGMDPQTGDVVCLENFCGGGRHLAIPQYEPLVIHDSFGGFFLVSFRSRLGRVCKVKVHRNTIFVIERLSWRDGVINVALQPVDYISSTEMGKWVNENMMPYYQGLRVWFDPVVASLSLGLSSAKIAIGATRGVASMGIETQPKKAGRASNESRHIM